MQNSVVFDEEFNHGWPDLKEKKSNRKKIANGQPNMASNLCLIFNFTLLAVLQHL